MSVTRPEFPTWEEFIIPTLQLMSDGETRGRREITRSAAKIVGLSDEQMLLTLDSGSFVYANRVGWVLSLLYKVGAFARPLRGQYVITEAGRELLRLFPDGVTEKQVKELAEKPESPLSPYKATPRKSKVETPEPQALEALSPIEQVQFGMERIHQDVAEQLLRRLQEMEPAFFEQAVVNLLLAMGYGGTSGSGAVTALSHDGGIDGVIDQDILGLNKVYIQAKRHAPENSVQRPAVQAFVGALSGRADSGVLITTSTFSRGAEEYATSIPTRIILVDGERLANLMIRFGVGVQIQHTFKVVEVDEDFFIN